MYAGNIGLNKYIVQVIERLFVYLFELKTFLIYFEFVQVTPMGVRLLQGDEQVQHIPLDLGSPIVHASSSDPHIIVLTEDGQLLLLTFREMRGQGRLTVSRSGINLVSVSSYFRTRLETGYITAVSNTIDRKRRNTLGSCF